MKIICADYILLCDNEFNIIENGAVCFDELILDVGKFDEICKKYKNAKIIKTPKNSILMPGLINVHTHLEFSANRAKLVFGDFVTWLKSVINERDMLISEVNSKLMEKILLKMLKSGTTSLGEISSFGEDLEPCKRAAQRVVFFNEALGSGDFKKSIENFNERLRRSKNLSDDRLIPAVSVHSPYSTSPQIASYLINLAKQNGYLVSTHFLESFDELIWLESAKGKFLEFFSGFNPDVKPFYTPKTYMQMFAEVKSLFTHGVYLDEQNLEILSKFDMSLTHCPISNRLLGSKKLDLKKILKYNINLTLATDGLSSNISLNLWDELRVALLVHFEYELSELAKILLLAVTKNAAFSLDLNCGEIAFEKFADFAIICLKDLPKDLSLLPLELILRTSEASEIYIQGQKQCLI